MVSTSLTAAPTRDQGLSLKEVSLQPGFKFNGNSDLYRYVSTSWRMPDHLWKVGLENESSLTGLVGRFQEYRVYAHRYADYAFLPQWEDIEWFLGGSVSGSQLGTAALSPDIGFRIRRPHALVWIPFLLSEDLSLYTNAIQSKTTLDILPLSRPFDWPLIIGPQVNYLWFGPFASSTSSSLGVGIQVRVLVNE